MSKKIIKKPELLAPAGNLEKLKTAFAFGADAVYLGIPDFSLRVRINDFTMQSVKQAVDYAHGLGKKAYVTVNIFAHNHHLKKLPAHIRELKKIKPDGIFISDPGIMTEIKKIWPQANIILSTQANCTNWRSAKFWQDQGMSRVILGREVSLAEAKEIRKKVPRLELECFVHGALCMAISGKCYLSLHEHNHSANRGDCFQVCRRTYTVKDKERGNELDIDNEYIMSPKDLMTIHFLNKIINNGVRVLKIEGRARSPEYVKTVTSCYHEAINAIIDGSYGAEKIEDWKKRLATVFNRGFWDGYYLGQRLGEWSEGYGSQATERKIYTGKGTNYFDKIKVAEFLIETGELKVGDKILITGPTTGVVNAKVQEIRVNDKSVKAAKKGDRCSVPLKETIRRSDKLYRIVDPSEVKLQ